MSNKKFGEDVFDSTLTVVLPSFIHSFIKNIRENIWQLSTVNLQEKIRNSWNEFDLLTDCHCFLRLRGKEDAIGITRLSPAAFADSGPTRRRRRLMSVDRQKSTRSVWKKYRMEQYCFSVQGRQPHNLSLSCTMDHRNFIPRLAFKNTY